MLRHTNKNGSKNSNNSNSNISNRNDQVRIYFPSISIQVLQHALHGTPNSSNKQKQKQTQAQTQNQKIPTTTKLDKYLCSENQKTIMYGTTCILEILNFISIIKRFG